MYIGEAIIITTKHKSMSKIFFDSLSDIDCMVCRTVIRPGGWQNHLWTCSL